LTEYDYFQEQIVKFIVLKGGSVASSGRDREFTDWNALAGFVDRFLHQATAALSPHSPRAPGS
jgi:menaquinone-dependent protoporphyrinogen oxidase